MSQEEKPASSKSASTARRRGRFYTGKPLPSHRGPFAKSLARSPLKLSRTLDVWYWRDRVNEPWILRRRQGQKVSAWFAFPTLKSLLLYVYDRAIGTGEIPDWQHQALRELITHIDLTEQRILERIDALHLDIRAKELSKARKGGPP